MKATSSKFRRWIGVVIFILLGACLWSFFTKVPMFNDKHDNFYERIVLNIENGNFPTVLHFNKLNDLFIIGYEHGNIELISTSNPYNKKTIKTHSHRISHLSTSYDGKILASSSYFEDDTRVLDISTGKIVATIKNTRGPVLFYMKSHTMIIPSEGQIKIYNPEKDEINVIKYPFQGTTTSISASNNGQYLAAGNSIGEISLWKIIKHNNKFSILDIINNNYAISLEPTESKTISIDQDGVTSIFFANNDTELFATFSSGQIYSWKLGFLGKEQMITTKLKGLPQAFITGNADVLVTGSGYPNDAEYESIEFITKMNQDTKILKRKLRIFTPVLYLENQNILIAPYKDKLIPINIYDYTQ